MNLKEKYGIEYLSILWIVSGSIGIILSSIIAESNMGYYWGVPFVGLGVFGIVTDMRKHKKQTNKTTSL